MGINITEIGQKVLDNNTNAANVFRKMYDLHYNPNPLDVPFEYIDENGNKVTTNIPNVANFRKKIWDDVGGAIGQMSRTFYVDAENGDDNNTGSSDSPFKTITKAINSIPVGGRGIIILLSDIDIANEPGNVYFNNRKILLRLDGHTLTKSDYKCFVCTDFFGYIKLYSGNDYTSTINILDNTSGIIRFVDTIGACVIGDYDSVLNINVKGKVVESLRSQIKGYAIRCNFTGLSDDTYTDIVIARDADQVDFRTHATCNFSNMRFINNVATPFVVREQDIAQQGITLYVDYENGSDKNPGDKPDRPLKTIEKAVQKAPTDLVTYIKLMSDYTINSRIDIYTKTIFIDSYDNNVDTAAKLTIKVIDNGDGTYTTPIYSAFNNAMFSIRTHVEFDGNGQNIVSCVNMARGQFKLSSVLVNSEGVAEQIQVDCVSPVKIGAGKDTNWWKCSFNTPDTNCIIYNVPTTGTLDVLPENTINGEAITVDNLKQYIVGIIFDADSGNPVNLLCNLNLSN
ncbi:DUF1565 domain-containing protein [Hydrogenimonas thermophila]|uniref:DUF1565 domain-containing protein n=1 Tax=Hydrogenimonas thermophila TaxID=223786 RepID=UPI002936F3E0|nr:DUF1565 domain-containing protein [Hydrogenimonas thermophila]WOE69087.1 DUF1565 domain-containing protein [Hydrogenimonas thermophila]WOE71597.1 DUF1565 domain-containing protein [Hydrogenimonas thermophila]